MSQALSPCRLFSDQLELPTPSESFELDRFDRLVQRVMRESGVHRPGQANTPDAQIVRMFLQMTRHTYARLQNSRFQESSEDASTFELPRGSATDL